MSEHERHDAEGDAAVFRATSNGQLRGPLNLSFIEALGKAVRAMKGAEQIEEPSPDAFAWLIEDAVGGLGYYGGVAWTHEHLKAVRYSRREDAERAIMGLPNGWHLIGKAVEHGWHELRGAVDGGGTQT